MKVMAVGKNGGRPGGGKKKMDLNEMYEKILEEKIPMDTWDRFILERL
jgi:hypothetical protein